jgi:hypothetical protein
MIELVEEQVNRSTATEVRPRGQKTTMVGSHSSDRGEEARFEFLVYRGSVQR